jgi:hypothetical protein
MKLIAKKNQLAMNPSQMLRRAGYAFLVDRRTGQESYAMHLGSGRYPRLHMYVSEQGDEVSFNLHLDQKQTSYAGSSRHNAEYDGEVVAGEIERLRRFFGLSSASTSSSVPASSASTASATPAKGTDPSTLADIMGHGEWQKYNQEPPRRSWLRDFFGL